MNLSHKRIAEIRKLVSAGIQLGRTEAEDMLGHNDHLTELCEARARLVLRAESESETLRSLYQMHKQTETREMRDLKAELAGLKTGYEAYERVNAELRAECEKLRKDSERLNLYFEIMSEAARNVLRFSEPTCLNDEKYRDRLEEMSKEQSHD